MVALFLVIMALLYSYLPIRAAMSPSLNWGNPIDWERFKYHFFGKQYQVWVFSSSAVTKKQLAHFFKTLPAFTGYVGLALILWGIVKTYSFRKPVFFFLLVLTISTILFSSNYDISDIDAYFLLAYLGLSLFAGIGLYAFLNSKDNKLKGNAIWSVLILPISVLGLNFKASDQSSVKTFDTYSKEVLQSAAPNSLIISRQWDYLVTECLYLQFVENYRTDVRIIDRELLRRSWYYPMLHTQMPEVVKGIEPEENQFKTLLQPFERGKRFDPEALQTVFLEISKKLISTNMPTKTVYLTPEIVQDMESGDFVLPENVEVIPDCFMFRVVPKNSGYQACNCEGLQVDYSAAETNSYAKNIKDIHARALAWRAQYEHKYGFKNKALKLNRLAEALAN
jgi:hypothetical protein